MCTHTQTHIRVYIFYFHESSAFYLITVEDITSLPNMPFLPRSGHTAGFPFLGDYSPLTLALIVFLILPDRL